MVKTIKQDVAAVERRLSAMESVLRLSAGVQRTSLAKAERLRVAAAEVVESSGDSSVFRDLSTVNRRKLARLAALLQSTQAFHVPTKGKLPVIADRRRDALVARVKELRKAIDDALHLVSVPDHAQDDEWRAEEQRLQAVAAKGGRTR